jgi:hypothetical protein
MVKTQGSSPKRSKRVAKHKLTSALEQALSKIPTQYSKPYKTNVAAMRRRVYRHEAKQREETDKAPKKIELNRLGELVTKAGLQLAMEKVTAMVSVHRVLTGKGALLRTSKKEKKLKLNMRRLGKGKVSLLSTLEHVEMSDVEWHLYFKGMHWVTIQQSTIPGAEFGLFAAQDFDEGDKLGLYCGKQMSTLSEEVLSKKDEYTILAKNGVLYGCSHDDVYMGMHFLNEPVDGEPPNCHICENLTIDVTTPIKKGEEIFAHYNRCDITGTE